MRKSPKRFALSLGSVGFVFFFFCVLPAPVFSAGPASRPRLAVFSLGNETGNAVYDAACAGAERSLVLTLRQLGTYELESQSRSVGRSDEALRAAAMERNADYVMFGGIGSGRGKDLVFRLGLFDRAKGKTTLLKESPAVSSLGLFEAMDDVISQVLDGITGGHLGFGSIELANTGEKGTYRVLLDGMDAGDDLAELPRVLAGTHTVSVMQRRMLGQAEIARSGLTVKEGEVREFTFAVPYLTAQEKERLETAEAEIRKEWESPLVAAKTEERVATYAAMLRDVSYSPRLVEYQGKSRQLEAEWAILKNRFEIEERAWKPDSLLLDPSMVVYLTAKRYPDPEALRRGAESNASLLATLHELAAGVAMEAGRYEEGVRFLESILDFSRYLPSERKGEYAFAVAKIKELVSTRETNPDKFKSDLEVVFGKQMKAGRKLASLEDAAKKPGEAVVIASDTGAELSVGSASAEVGPILAKSGGEVSVLIASAASSSETRLEIAAGRRLAFVESGFSAFGRTKGDAVAGPMAPLRFKCAPRGYTVYANGEKVGITPLGQVMVPAGFVTLRFERAGEAPKSRVVNAVQNRETTLVWGEGANFPIELERRTIPLSDDTGAWDGVDPIWEGRFTHYLEPLSAADYAITRIFMCKDDKYLYWRIDFAGANPFVKPPKGIGREVVTQMTCLFDVSKELNTGLYKNFVEAKVDSYQGVWAAGKWTSKGDHIITFRNGPTTILQRVQLNRLPDEKGPTPVYFFLANKPDSNSWGPGTLKTPTRYIDLSD